MTDEELKAMMDIMTRIEEGKAVVLLFETEKQLVYKALKEYSAGEEGEQGNG